MKRMLAALAAIGMGLMATGALAQSLEAIDKADEAVWQAWDATPLTFRHAVFVGEPPQGFGVYKDRANSTFKSGESLVVYAEPVGYAYKDNGNGTYSFGFNVDLIVKSPSGEIVGGQENFQKLELTSRAKNREFMLTLTLDLTNAPPGDYVLEYKTHDLNSDKVGLMSLPFTLTK